MLLEIFLFSINDILLVPVCLILLYAIIRNRANACPNESIRKYYYRAFYFKIICVFFYSIVTEFYFGGGDTLLYYQGIKDLRAALTDDVNHFSYIITSSGLTDDNPLSPYFMYDRYVNDITYNYMHGAANFFIPRLGLIPSIIFYHSYLCICFCFMMFSLGGAIRIFKTFYHFYPSRIKEIALATLFLPSVGFWSSGLLKDTICFGAVGFMVYAFFNIFIRRRKFVASLIWIVISGYLLYTIKTYIFLVLLLALIIWIFAETNKLIKERTLRQIFAFMTLSIAALAGYLLLQYFTSAETLKQYQLENIVSSAENQRNNYLIVDKMYDSKTSYYSINASNPVLLVLNSIIATFFRPFPWEVRSAAAVLSALEALTFLILTINLFLKIGIVRPFKLIFKDPRVLMSFIFSIIFAIGVGASTANFGSLSRYKIPCMPFYMITLLFLYKNSGVPYPKWLNYILGYKNS